MKDLRKDRLADSSVIIRLHVVEAGLYFHLITERGIQYAN